MLYERIKMKFFKLILSIFFAHNIAFAYFNEHIDYAKDINILKNLDIDPHYIKDPDFLKLKEKQGIEYKKHLMRAIKEQYANIVLVQEALKDEEIPDEMLYLAVVESGLRNKATSRQGAAGVWQLIPRTAKTMGLKVQGNIDERRDPVASTKAAAKYLKMLNEKFGKWYLAILAYNCGEGALRRAITRAGSDDMRVLLNAQKRYLSKETRNFVRKIIITAQIAEDLNQVVSSGYGLFNNPNISNDALKNEAIKNATHLALKGLRSYKVRKGDTLMDISRKFRTSIKALMIANDMQNTSLTTGVNLVIPKK